MADFLFATSPDRVFGAFFSTLCGISPTRGRGWQPSPLLLTRERKTSSTSKCASDRQPIRARRLGPPPKMNTAMVDAQPTRPIAKLGLVGEGGVVHLPASCCSFLMDASEYIEDGLFAVPFSVAALRVVEAFCSTPIQVSSRPASRHGTPQLLRSRKPERMPCRVRRSSKPPWRGQRAPGLTRCPTLSSSS